MGRGMGITQGEWPRDHIEMNIPVLVGVSEPRVLIQRPSPKMLSISPSN